MIRIIDFFASLIGLIALSPILLVVTCIGLFDTGSPIFIQTRVGRNGQLFQLIKFRTMKIDTASVGTHQVDATAITPLGSFLRKTKLDELPQLFNVAMGQMSLVGPRPCLPNQIELIHEREERGVNKFRPGVTGLGQINNIDMSSPRKLARVDAIMTNNISTCFYFYAIFKTILGAGSGDNVAPTKKKST